MFPEFCVRASQSIVKCIRTEVYVVCLSNHLSSAIELDKYSSNYMTPKNIISSFEY